MSFFESWKKLDSFSHFRPQHKPLKMSDEQDMESATGSYERGQRSKWTKARKSDYSDKKGGAKKQKQQAWVCFTLT
jgi:hypothetical protein